MTSSKPTTAKPLAPTHKLTRFDEERIRRAAVKRECKAVRRMGLQNSGVLFDQGNGKHGPDPEFERRWRKHVLQNTAKAKQEREALVNVHPLKASA